MRCLLAVLLVLGACAPAVADCACAAARANDGWCDACGVGFVAGVKIGSAILFEALDAHGHDFDTRRLTCASCAEAVIQDGFCDEHGVGFVDSQAYVSRLAYHLARGERRGEASIDCAVCRRNARTHGWCEACGVGMLGPVAFADRAAFEPAARALRILLVALEKARQCELCAGAMVTDGRCPVCKIAYRDGVPLP